MSQTHSDVILTRTMSKSKNKSRDLLSLNNKYNCHTCLKNDPGKRVQCGRCENWHHYDCVGVDDKVKKIKWNCKNCMELLQKLTSKDKFLDLPQINTSTQNQHIETSKSLDGSKKTISTTSSIRAARILLAEQEKQNCERRDQEKIELRLDELRVRETFEKERLKIREQEIQMKEQREKQLLLEKKRIIDECSSKKSQADGGASSHIDSDRINEWLLKCSPNNSDNEKVLPKNNRGDCKFPVRHDKCAPYKQKPNQHSVDHCDESFINANQIAARQVLPKDLPIFSGDPLDWALFISAFQTTTQKCGYSNAENMVRLQRCLKGSALAVVKSSLLTPSKVPEVLNTLKMMFGKPEVIILSLIDQVRHEPSPKSDNLSTIINFALSVRNLSSTIEASDLEEYLNNPTLLFELVSKLPAQLKLEWAIFKRNRGGSVCLKVFSEWLYDLAEAASDVTCTSLIKLDAKSERRQKGHFQATHVTHVYSDESKPMCVMSDQETHLLKDCLKFRNLTLSKKWDVVTKFQLCRTCLCAHHGSKCKNQVRCGVNGCSRWHNSLLHKPKDNNQQMSCGAPDKSGLKTSAVINSHRNALGTYLFKVIPINLHGKNKTISTFAFLDDGSSISLLEEDIASELGLNGPCNDLCLKWTAEQSRVEQSSMIISVRVSGFGSSRNKIYSMSNVRTVKSLGLPVQSVNKNELISKFPHVQNVPLQSYTSAKPTMLIGLDNVKLLSALEIREGGWSDPVLSRTRLGWCIHGPTSVNNGQEEYVNIHVCDCNEQSLHDLVKQSFAIDNLGIKTSSSDFTSAENVRALDILKTTSRKIGDKYEVGLLWKFDTVTLPNSYPMALRRLECLEKKMQKNEEYASKLKNQIQYYVQKGYARKLDLNELRRSPKTWYLPLFTITNPNKPSKFRLVWDAAAKVDNICLNTMLSKGPDLLTPLIHVLYQFRERVIGICADLKEMFHQIHVTPADQDSQRFLWRDNPHCKPDEYVMQVMTFGAACSPCAAQFIKNENAKQFSKNYPEAANAILFKHYVDDYLDSKDNAEETINIARQVEYIHKNAGFELRNWHSNSDTVVKALNPSSDCDSVEMNMSDLPETEKVLGLLWCLGKDTFSYRINYVRLGEKLIGGSQTPTKRQLLRTLMTIYDPLGLLSPFLVYLKILLQDVWREKKDWDEEVSLEHHERWMRWVQIFNVLSEIHIPRCYSPKISKNQNYSIQLHTFVDASADAYAAVCYFRVEDSEGIQCSIVRAKSKVGPLNPISIPRMELQGAILGLRLANDVLIGHSVKICEKFFWTDSRCVLCWLHGDPKQYRQFVSFRVGEILESSNIEEWKWISSKLNIADSATKWSNGFHFDSASEWFNGPSFLYQNSSEWPKQKDLTETATGDLMIHISESMNYTPPKILLNINNYSNWERLLKAQCYFQRAVKCFKSKSRENWFWSHEIFQAEIELFKLAQWNVFESEIRMLSKPNDKFIEKSSSIYTYSPLLDEHGLLRVSSRVESLGDVKIDQKYPIILPRYHKITDLLIDDYHKRFNHMNHESVINELRQRFAIPKIRMALQSVRKNCQICKNSSSSPKPPEMAALPIARLSPFTRPFTFVGMDFFGPIEVVLGRRCEKRWGVLFTCMTVRAIHLEVAHSLSSDSCILSIRNFMARRGHPSEIRCDNGTNMVGASNELKREIDSLPKGTITDAFPQIKWTFNPPASPHMGGAWESLVKIVKKNLMIVMPKRKPGDELLRACLIEIENTVNSRPLTHIAVDPDEPEAITPNHFLLGSSSGVKPSGVFSDEVFVLRKNWKISQQVAQSFWVRWLREYVPTITRRTKWFTKVKPIEVGDVVVIADEKNPRNTWPLGRVINVQISRDNQVRQATVQTSTGIYVRPAAKLAVLDVQNDRNEGKSSVEARIPGGNVVNSPKFDSSQNEKESVNKTPN